MFFFIFSYFIDKNVVFPAQPELIFVLILGKKIFVNIRLRLQRMTFLFLNVSVVRMVL